MKITFEGQNIRDIIEDMKQTLYTLDYWKDTPEVTAPPVTAKPQAVEKPVQKPVEKPVEKPVDIFADIAARTPVEKPKRERTEKQKANDEKMRVAALEKIAAKKAAKAAAAAPVPMPTPPPPKSAEGMDPAEVVKMREKTLEELREAYGNGFDKEVLELLSRFGNGAKSFRELPPESFVPIREAIDNGALT